MQTRKISDRDIELAREAIRNHNNTPDTYTQLFENGYFTGTTEQYLRVLLAMSIQNLSAEGFYEELEIRRSRERLREAHSKVV